MKILIYVFPVALLVAYSQIAIKWRTLGIGNAFPHNGPFLERLLKYLLDPIIMTAYIAALLASFVWLYVITKLPLVVAFPIYIGTTFLLVIVGGWFFLAESITVMKLCSAGLILLGIALGIRS